MNYEQLKQNCPAWQDYIHHPFVNQLAAGTLPMSAFRYYLQQDYLFLQQFIRAWGLAVYKSHHPEEMRAAQAAINALLDYELQLHIQYCAGYGISEETLLTLEEDPANIAYTRYVLDCGNSGTLVELHAAMMPCIVGYAEIGQHFAPQSPPDNPFQSWLDLYASEKFQTVAIQAVAAFDKLLANTGLAQQRRLHYIFNTATRMEVNFWQMGLDHA